MRWLYRPYDRRYAGSYHNVTPLAQEAPRLEATRCFVCRHWQASWRSVLDIGRRTDLTAILELAVRERCPDVVVENTAGEFQSLIREVNVWKVLLGRFLVAWDTAHDVVLLS
jgi:hypothetical protein